LYFIVVLVFIILTNFISVAINSQKWHDIFARIFVFIEFFFITYFFLKKIKIIFSKNLVRIFFALYTLQSEYINYQIVALECLFILVYFLLYLFEVMKVEMKTPIGKTVFFWIALGFFIYGAGNLFLFLYTNNSTSDEEFIKVYDFIYGTVTIVKNILFCIGLSIKDKSLPTPTDNNLFTNQWDIPNTNRKT
jgi:hypothetical protein